ncbi:MAG: serine/threonine-protein kinase RsbW [Actinomycetota bacterium]|jgi:serine/threonine-protein kinase RsbW|nr:serine/threonine-protein kinase RsbW [Actinomycetota bacterium]
MGSTRLRRDDSDRSRSLHLPIEPAAIAVARRAAASAARDAGLGPDRTDDLVVAVSEACTNALEAQQRAGVATPIEISTRMVGATLEVVVVDRGAGFAPESIAPRPPLAHPGHLDVERGWGIQLMRSLVDDLDFIGTGDGTAVVLRCHLQRG